MGFLGYFKKYNVIDIYGYKIKYELPCKFVGEKKWDRSQTLKKFKDNFGYELNLEDPKTLNEKIQWLKLYEHEDFHTIVADKYEVRNYWKQFGEEGLIPLLFMTYDWRDITSKNIPDEPCIVKCNSGSAAFQIIRDKTSVDFKKLRRDCKSWLSKNFYYCSQEWQYKNIKPCIIVEKLLQDSNGHIPNDYKLNFINGKLQFVYCSIDREGENYRSIYSPEWNKMEFAWIPKSKKTDVNLKIIPQPATFERMKEIGSEIAKNFKYVRVDFYDVEGKLYYGEITLHHGSGYDTFRPEKYDSYYGKLLDLGTRKNRRKKI